MAGLGTWLARIAGVRKSGGSWSVLTGSSGVPHSYPWNWWQMDKPRMSVGAARNVPIVYACVMANARAVALCTPTLRRELPGGGFERVDDGAIAAVLRTPNSYETWPQYVLNTVAEMLFSGAAVSLIVRDADGQPAALHRIASGAWSLYIDPQSRTVFYGISETGNPLMPADLDYLVPARDVVHFRAHTPRHPLIGESPVVAAALAVGINVALSRSQAAFFEQMRRPSGILHTDEKLNAAQMAELRTAFDAQAARWEQGGLPVLAWGVKYQQLAISSADAQVIEAQRMTVEDVCRVYGVPPPIVADLSHATLNNASELARMWLALGLASLLENLERSLDKAFGLPVGECIEFDTAQLLRADFVARMDALSKAIAGGVYAPNEARAQEGLPPIEGGDEAFLQRQMVPVSLLAQLAGAELARAAAPPPAPAPRTLDADGVDDVLAAEWAAAIREGMAA